MLRYLFSITLIALLAIFVASQLDTDNLMPSVLARRASSYLTHFARGRAPFIPPNLSTVRTASFSASADPTSKTESSMDAHKSNDGTLNQSPSAAPDSSHNGTPLPLPAPGDDDVHRLDMSNGDTSVKLGHLGPLVVNQDGTLSRISNWGQMTEQEKKNTLRVLGKRNKLRTDALKAQAGSQDEGQKP